MLHFHVWINLHLISAWIGVKSISVLFSLSAQGGIGIVSVDMSSGEVGSSIGDDFSEALPGHVLPIQDS